MLQEQKYHTINQIKTFFKCPFLKDFTDLSDIISPESLQTELMHGQHAADGVKESSRR